jgi:ketosteroid isomerase-like protein
MEVRPVTSTTEATTAVVRAMYDTAAAGDLEAFWALVDDNIEAYSPADFPWAGPHHGATAWRDQALPFLAAVHDFTRMSYELIANGDKCAALVRVGIKDSDEEVRYTEVWTVDNHKVVHLRVYCYDPRPVYRQIEKLGIGA